MNTTTQTGNLTRAPEVKFMNNGDAQVRLGIAVNRKWTNKQTNEVEERVSYFTVVAYGKLAQNVAESLTTGARVIVTGRIEHRTWETPEGDKREIVEIIAEDIGPSLSWATAIVSKNVREDYAKPSQASGRQIESWIDEAF